MYPSCSTELEKLLSIRFVRQSSRAVSCPSAPAASWSIAASLPKPVAMNTRSGPAMSGCDAWFAVLHGKSRLPQRATRGGVERPELARPAEHVQPAVMPGRGHGW